MPHASSPYTYLPEVPSFTLTSETVENGTPLVGPQYSALLGVPGGQDESPQLSWSGFPPETKSFMITMYDPQAPTGSGFWHWVLLDLPASTTSFSVNAGHAGADLPGTAIQLAGDAGAKQFVGAAPPPNSGVHDYFITVTALGVESLGVPAEASAAYAGFVAGSSTLARATIVCPTDS